MVRRKSTLTTRKMDKLLCPNIGGMEMKSRTLSILTLLLVGSTLVGGVQAEAAVRTRNQVKTVSYRTISNRTRQLKLLSLKHQLCLKHQ